MSLTFKRMRELNVARSRKWENGAVWSLSDWMTALVGEVGEAANFIKKLNRLRDGMTGNKLEDRDPEVLREKFRKELGDIQLYLDLIADAAGIDLEQAARDVFNQKSEELGFEERM